ncbi:CocE/NonD family hydrolase [Pseudothermotoga thermarum]|uniref:Xaa-Pro dipeptidyl-peptidase-like domain-containing protein n=1 Tax=Pseudothermotoga thermarum DSM 5069 TaxID=688269 RepID=F7YY38_9THEM|nr:CocE/NonD family hydrolase [Pseudothermotoga thermarum]AEH50848.1 hypothetical protein Theth_0763 [Pseudothermotoga thermarum DSM 5069]
MIYYDKNKPFNEIIEKFEEYDLISFDTVYEPDIPESKRVYVYNFKPLNPWFNLIFIHGIRNGNIPYLMWFAKYFKNFGIQTYYLILPYHAQRAKPNWLGGEPFFSTSPAFCCERFHQAVKDVRRTIDYIETKSALPVAIMGFSFGGMIATMALALDKRIKAGILAFTGGDWYWINWFSPYTKSLRNDYKRQGNEIGCRNAKTCFENRKNAMQNVDKLTHIEEIFSLTPQCFHYDPISYAKFVEQPVLFFEALFDRIIVHKASEQLFKKLQKAKKIFVPSGHKSTYLFRKIIAKKVVDFLSEMR